MSSLYLYVYGMDTTIHIITVNVVLLSLIIFHKLLTMWMIVKHLYIAISTDIG